MKRKNKLNKLSFEKSFKIYFVCGIIGRFLRFVFNYSGLATCVVMMVIVICQQNLYLPLHICLQLKIHTVYESSPWSLVLALIQTMPIPWDILQSPWIQHRSLWAENMQINTAWANWPANAWSQLAELLWHNWNRTTLFSKVLHLFLYPLKKINARVVWRGFQKAFVSWGQSGTEQPLMAHFHWRVRFRPRTSSPVVRVLYSPAKRSSMALHSLNGHDPGDKRRSAVVQGWIGNMSPFTIYCYTQKEE